MTSGRPCAFGPLEVRYDERVITPRPWTFAQSEWAVEICARAEPGPLLELCAGAGHIGLAAAVLADRDLIQVELDPIAAGYARTNATHAGWSARTEIRTARLDQALGAHERFAVINADPPYLPSAEVSRWPEDPRLAIDGGADGLDLIGDCLRLAAQHLSDAGLLLLQIAGPAQDRQTTQLVEATPAWGLARRDVRVVDDERAILLLARSSANTSVRIE